MKNPDVINSSRTPNFDGVVDIISKLSEPDMASLTDEDGYRYEYLEWNGSIRKLDLEPQVIEQADLGQSARAVIVGDSNEGIAIIMRSRNPFYTRRFGFYIKPTEYEELGRGIEVWQAPAIRPRLTKSYLPIELLDCQQAQLSSPEVSESLIKTLQQAAL
jgi:hypothetical protein